MPLFVYRCPINRTPRSGVFRPKIHRKLAQSLRPRTSLTNGPMLPFSECMDSIFLQLGKGVVGNYKTSYPRAASPLHAMWLAFKVATGTR